MAAARRRWAAELLHFWFHTLHAEQWFDRHEVVDSALRKRFARVLAALQRRPAREFLRDRLTARAAILLFDQCPRNIYRDDRRAFAADPLARAIVKGALRRDWHRRLGRGEAQFVLMPLMHSEAMADQQASLARFAALGDARNLAFARRHYRMIARFGRFPHRNAVLGRTSSKAELRAVAAGNAW